MSRDPRTDFSRIPLQWVSRSEAALLTGLHVLTLKKMVISGAVPTRRYANRDVANVLVDRLWIDENKAALHSGIDFRDAVALLGISHGSLKEAREVGLLCQQHRSKFKRTLSRTDVDAFASRMRALCRTEGTGEPRCFVALNSLFVRHCLSPKERVQFYRALLDNDVTLRLLGVTFAIDRLEMDKDAAEHLLRSLGFWKRLIDAARTDGTVGCERRDCERTSARRMGRRHVASRTRSHVSRVRGPF